MAEADGSDIPVRVENNEQEKLVGIMILWHRLGKLGGDAFKAWLMKTDMVRRK